MISDIIFLVLKVVLTFTLISSPAFSIRITKLLISMVDHNI
nr:MAG TPA: hypothetical protein [Caudoviricetes sp.]